MNKKPLISNSKSSKQNKTENNNQKINNNVGEAENKTYDEMFNTWENFHDVKPHYQVLASWLQNQQIGHLQTRQIEAEAMFRKVGITFTVYNDTLGNERTIPFDLIPRVISQKEWKILQAGLIQRVTALNMFLHDIYSNQRIIKDNIIPKQIGRAHV